MRFAKKLGRSNRTSHVSKQKALSALSEAAHGTVENLESRQLLSSVYLNFNNISDFNQPLNVIATGANSTLVYANNSGIIDSGTVHGGGLTGGGTGTSVGTDISATYKYAATPLADGAVHTISMMGKDSDSNTGDKPLQIGWSAGPTQTANGTVPFAFISGRILGFSQINAQSGNNGATGNGSTSTFNFSSPATSGDWLKLTVTAQETNTATGVFTMTFGVQDYGPNGNGTPTVLLAQTSTSTETTAGMANISGYPTFRAAGAAVTTVFDNLFVDQTSNTPGAVSTLAATSTGVGVSLNWTADPSATTYNILRSTASGNEVQIASTYAPNTFLDTTGLAGTTYFYEVQGVNNSNSTTGPVSNEANAIFALAPLMNPIGGNNSINVVWNQAPNVLNYTLSRASYNPVTNVTGTYSQISPAAPFTATSFLDSTALNGTYYSYQMTATYVGNVTSASTAAVVAAPGTLIKFNSAATDVTNNFIVAHDGVIGVSGTNTTTGNFQNFGWVGTAGIDDNVGGAAGGGIITTNEDQDLNYDASSFDLTKGATTSVMFEETSNPGTARIGQIGFLNLLNTSFNVDSNGGAPFNAITAPGTAFIGIRPYGNGLLEMQTKAAGTVVSGTPPVTTQVGAVAATLVPAGTSFAQNEWYRVGFTIAETAPGSGLFNYIATIDDFGSTGTAFTKNINTVKGLVGQAGSSTIALVGFDATNGSGADTGWAGIRQATDQPNLDNFNTSGTPAAAGPTKPTLSAAANDNDVLLQWTQSAGALTYQILRSSDGGSTFTQILGSPVTGTAGTNSFLDTNVQDGNSYEYEVIPFHGTLQGTTSNITSNLLVGPQPPNQVTGVTVATTPGVAVLNWSAVPFATGYTVLRSGSDANGVNLGTYQTVGTTTGNSATTFTDNAANDLISSPPTSGNIYYYEIVANISTNTAPNNVGSPSTPLAANFKNGVEDFIYNNLWWKSSNQSATGFNNVGLNFDAEQFVGSANLVGAAGVSPVTANSAFTNTNFSELMTGKIILTDADLGLSAGDTTDTAGVTFGMISDDGGALVVNGTLVASNPLFTGGSISFQGATTTTAGAGTPNTLSLSAGTYDFEMFESQGTGAWQSTMVWSTPATQAAATPAQGAESVTNPNTFVVVPQTAFLAATGAPSTPTNLALQFTASPNLVPLQWTNTADNELDEIVQRSTTSDFSPNTFNTIATLPNDIRESGQTGINSQGRYNDVLNDLTQNTWYRVISINMDGSSTTNIIPVQAETTTASSGLAARYYSGATWASGSNSATAYISPGVSITTAGSSHVNTINDTNNSNNGPDGNIVGGTSFSDAFTGKLTVQASGSYVFDIGNVASDPGALFINGAQVASGAAASVQSAPITLNTGTTYYFDYFHSHNNTNAWAYEVQFSGPDSGGTVASPVFEAVPQNDLTQNAGTPTGVQNFAQTSPDGSHVNLVWTPNTDGTLDYQIQRSTDSGFDGLGHVQTVTTGISSGSYSDTTVQPNTTYFYRIQAINFDGISALNTLPSITTSTKLATPTNVKAIQGGFDNVVTFTNNATTGLASFNVLRSTNGGAYGAPVGTVAAGATKFVDSNLPATALNTTYAYEIQAVATSPETNSDVSAASATETLIAVSGIPGNALTIPSTGNGQLTANGGASITNNSIVLTTNAQNQTRSVYGTSGMPVTGAFSTSFDFQFTDPNATAANAADGFTFVLQNANPTAIGGGGGGFGYTGGNLGNSIAIAFNMFNNVTTTGLGVNGAAPTLADMSSASGGAFGNAFHNIDPTTFQTDIFHVTLQYSTLTDELVETVKDTGSITTGGTGTHTYSVAFPISSQSAGSTIAAILGNGGAYAFAGFTGATGGATAIQTITNWNFVTVPAPSVASLMPASGAVAGGTSVTITGTGFTGATAVNFGSNPATTFTVVNDTTITATDPAGSAGTVDVQVVTPLGGVSPIATTDHFVYGVSVAAPNLVGSPVINGDNPSGLSASGTGALPAQRSMVEDVVYTFDSAVTIPNANTAFTVVGAGTHPGTAPATLSAAAVAGSNGTQWAVTLTGGAAGALGSIGNGEYTITINGAGVFSAADGTTQLATGAGQVDKFYRLFGDAVNGDRTVNAADNLKFKAAINGAYNPVFDFDGGGAVNAGDNLQFKKDLTVGFADDTGFVPTI